MYHAAVTLTDFGKVLITLYGSINYTTRSLCSVGININAVVPTVFYTLQEKRFRRLNISTPVVRVGNDLNILKNIT